MAATQRLELRLTEEAKKAMTAAAALVDEPVSEFVRAAAEQRADTVLGEHRVTWVPATFFDDLLAALDDPVDRNEPLTRAARRAHSVVKPI